MDIPSGYFRKYLGNRILHLPLTYSSASSGMLGLGWASVASGRLMSAALETAGLINVESLIRPGCKSRTSLAKEEIL